MGNSKKISLKYLIIFPLILLLFLSVLYKYFEWNVQKQLREQANNASLEEYSLNEESMNYSNKEVLPLLERMFLDDTTSAPDGYIELVDKLMPKLNVLEDMDKNSLMVFEGHGKEYEAYKTKKLFLIGGARRFVNDFISYQNSTYDKVVETGRLSVIENSLYKQYFAVGKDMELSNIFSRKMPSDNNRIVKYVKDNYYSLGTLEKYTRDDFKFDNEDDIKTKTPYGYEVLSKYRDYLKSYYLIVKDYVADDLESASYKWTKLSQQLTDFNIDYEKLFGENSEVKKSNQQENLLIIAKMAKLIKDYQAGGERKYPVLGSIGKFKDDLYLCEMYISKADLFKEITKDYPKSEEPRSLINELATIMPKTDFVDSLFDYDMMKVVVNDEKTIQYECLDKDTGKNYKYEVIK